MFSRKHTQRGFTLMETLLVVVILGTLAAVVTPQFTGATDDAFDTTIRAQLQRIRKQIELHNNLYPTAQYDADTPVATFWDDLVDADLMAHIPINPFQNSTSVADAPAMGVGWVWGLNADGDADSLNVYAVDRDGTLYDG